MIPYLCFLCFINYSTLSTDQRIYATFKYNAKYFRKCPHIQRGGSHLEWTASPMQFFSTCIWNSPPTVATSETGFRDITLLELILKPEVMKTGSANLNFLCKFSQLPLSNISLFTVLFTCRFSFSFFF